VIANIRSPLIRYPLVVLAWLVVVLLGFACLITCAVAMILFFGCLFVMERIGDNAWRGPPLKRNNESEFINAVSRVVSRSVLRVVSR
jgi:hypothetical protein